jgi:hypothetical protein
MRQFGLSAWLPGAIQKKKKQWQFNKE